MQSLNESIEATSACPACGAFKAIVVATKDGKSSDALLTIQCVVCGLGRIDPLPTKETLSEWYKSSYREEYKSAVSPSLRHILRAGRNAMDRWHWYSGFVKPAGPKAEFRSVDIGASSGEFVFLLKTLGYFPVGIEPHAGYGSYAVKTYDLDIHSGTLEDNMPKFALGSQHLISMFHVFEHLVDPIQTLQLLSKYLHPSGHLFIEVPDATRLCAPHTMFFKAHTLYFTKQSLAQVFAAAGLSIVHVSDPQTENLRILARPLDGSNNQSANQSTTASTNLRTAYQPEQSSNLMWANDGTLIQSQAQRRWAPYLMSQLSDGTPVKKVRRQIEERRTSGQFTSSKELLTALYLGH